MTLKPSSINHFGFQPSAELSLSRETLLIKKLFDLKKNLDFISYADLSIKDNYSVACGYGDTLNSLLSDKVNDFNINTSISQIESTFLTSNLDKNFSKISLSESSAKKLNTDVFLSTTLEDTIESTLDTASSNR